MTIDIRDFESMIKDHMNTQPYNISCADCGGNLHFTAKIDRDFDLTLEVSACDSCIKDAMAEVME